MISKAHSRRLIDDSTEPGKALPPIQGFENEPLVSLDEAVRPLIDIVHQIENMVHVAKTNCKNPKDNLTIDESASIMLYSMEWTPIEHSFYRILNATLRSEKRQNLKPWFRYLRLFIFALSKLKSVSGTIYRGVKMDLRHDYPVNKEFIWWGFSSCTTSIHVLENDGYLGRSGTRTLFMIECDDAKDIRNHSMFSFEDEVLLLAARKFKVTACLNCGNNLYMIQLKEIQPKFPLLAYSSSVQTKTSSYRNEKLENIIDKIQPYAEAKFAGENLIDNDMELIVTHIINGKQCSAVNLEDNKLTPRGISLIASALNNNRSLEKLILNSNRVAAQGAQFLSKVLAKNNCHLQILALASTYLSDIGVQQLVEMLKTNQSLTFLDLANNGISNRGAQNLFNVLTQQNSTVQIIYLHKNTAITDAIVEPMIEMFKQNQSLTFLDISLCGLTEDGKKKIREFLQTKTNVKINFE